MDSPYITGYGQGGGYASGSLDVNDVNNFDFIDPFQQQQSFDSQGKSSMARTRHDSVNLQGSFQVLHQPGQHQADYQPYVQQPTPLGTAYSSQSADMSRVTSRASYRSSTSSGQQRGGETYFVNRLPCSNNPLPSAVDMRRSRTAYSPRPPLFSYQTHPHLNAPQIYPPSTNYYDPNFTNELMVNPSTSQHRTTNISLDKAVIDYELTGLHGADNLGSGMFGNE
ncbi:hypothetical protein SVAN01_01903 [Stagonosporopsis vannaccii]|nr:hypothetical protein SVAN01_01903 [Stagonosporopsis vannaccii]